MTLRFSDNGYSVYTHDTTFSIGVTTDTATPLVINGSGSLRCGNASFSVSYANCIKEATPNHQMESGFLRERIRYVDSAYTAMSAYIGLMFHQSAADMTATGGSKAVAIHYNGSDVRLVIASFASTGLQAVPTIHQATTPVAISGGSIYSIAAEFLYHASFGGTQVRAWLNASSTLPDRDVDAEQLLHVFTESAPGALYCGEFLRNTQIIVQDSIKMMVDTVRRQELTP